MSLGWNKKKEKGKERYDLNDLNRYWLKCLGKEARRLEPQPLLIEACIGVLERHPDVLIGVGGGDRFAPKLGHTEEYKRFLSSPPRIGDHYVRANWSNPEAAISQKRYNYLADKIDEFFEIELYRDLDYAVVIKDEAKNRMNELVKEINAELKGATTKLKQEQLVPQSFKGFESLKGGARAWTERDVINMIKEYVDIVRSYPYDEKYSGSLRYKDGCLIIKLKPGNPQPTGSTKNLTLQVKAHTPPYRWREPRALIITPSKDLTEPEMDILEDRRAAVFYRTGGVSKELDELTREYYKLTGQPKNLPNHLAAWREYVIQAEKAKVVFTHFDINDAIAAKLEKLWKKRK